MSTNYHNALTGADVMSISTINTRLAALDAGIVTATASALPVSGAILYDSKATTVEGGASSATTWNTRTLNTEVDASGIVSLSSNQFTPASGTYVIQAHAPSNSVGLHRLRLYNVTQTSVTAYGPSALNELALLWYVFTVNGTDAYRIDHYTTSAVGSGLGNPTSDGSSEVYTTVLLLKVA